MIGKVLVVGGGVGGMSAALALARRGVEVELIGACGTCPASTVTMKAGIERILKDRVEGVTEVVAV